MKTITVEENVVKALHELGIEYNEGNVEYQMNWYDFRPYLIGLFLGVIVTISMSVQSLCLN